MENRIEVTAIYIIADRRTRQCPATRSAAEKTIEISGLPTQCMQLVRTVYGVVNETELSELLIR
jgi:hypothetical protein